MLKYYNAVDNDTIMICELCVSTCKYTRYTRYHLVLFVMIATVHESIATCHMSFKIIDARNPWEVGSIWGTWYPCSRYLSAIHMNVQKVASDQTTKIDPKFFFLSSFSLPLPLLLSFSLPFLFPSSSFPFPFLCMSFSFALPNDFLFCFPFPFPFLFLFRSSSLHLFAKPWIAIGPPKSDTQFSGTKRRQLSNWGWFGIGFMFTMISYDLPRFTSTRNIFNPQIF